jgi:hypothetical protein
MNTIQVMADQLADMREECDRLKRENAVLRQELKLRLVNQFIEDYEFSENDAEVAAGRCITHMILHNEGAE